MFRQLISGLVIVLCITCLGQDAFAAKKKKKKKKKPSPTQGIPLTETSDTWTVTTEDGKTISCAMLLDGTVKAGEIDSENSRFIEDKLTKKEKGKVKKLKQKIKNAPKKKKSKLKKQLNNVKQGPSKNHTACEEGQGSNPENPGNPGGPGEEEPTDGPAVSLEPLARTYTTADARKLLERYGFGSGKNSAAVLGEVGNGVEAVCNAMMAIQPEASGHEAVIEDYLDEELNNTPEEDDNPSFRGMRQGWLWHLINTNNPFRAKLAIFLMSVWTAGDDVINDENDNVLVWKYIKRLRTYANAPTMKNLAVAITTDALMLIYLDGASNLCDGPNENYARELMELFTMGPKDLDGNANYTEATGTNGGDIVSAARALTGWRVAPLTDANGNIQTLPVYSPENHCPGDKTMFPGTDYECTVQNETDLVNCMFGHPSASIYYAHEMLKYYLDRTPPRKLVENLAQVIKDNDYNLDPAFKALCQSEAFYHESYDDTLPKESVNLMVEFVRTLNIPITMSGGNGFERCVSDDMQQGLTAPPTVFWWDPDIWTSSSRAIEFANCVAKVLRDTTAQQGPEELGYTEENPLWQPADVLPTGAEVFARDVVKHVADKLGITLTSDEEDSLVFYMNNRRSDEGEFVRDLYDNLESGDQRRKGLGLYYILALSAAFQLM